MTRLKASESSAAITTAPYRTCEARLTINTGRRASRVRRSAVVPINGAKASAGANRGR